MKIIYIIGLLILIAGCVKYTPVKVEPVEVPAHFKETINTSNEGLKNDWWENFNNKNLNELVESALKNNVNYKIALENIAVAKAYEQKSMLSALPELFFNKGHNAKLQVEIVEAKSRMAKLTLVSEVTSVYFKIATINKNIANLSKQHTIISSLLKITKTQYDIGYVDSAALRDVANKEGSIKNDIRNLKKQQKIYINYLADLLGQYPEDFHVKIKPSIYETNFQELIPASIPAQVISNRPDIQAAFLQVQTVGDKSQYEEAMLNYKATIHNAFQEVDNALLSFKEDQQSWILEKAIVRNASADYKSAEIQYKAGQIDYAAYLSSELTMLQTKYALANQNLLVYEDIIQIYKVLGMGANEH